MDEPKVMKQVDVMKLLDVRRWMESACEANGAEVTGAGMHLQECIADLSFDFEGRSYSVYIKEEVAEEVRRTG